MVGRDIKHAPAATMLLDVLQNHGRLANSARADESKHARLPADLVVHITMECGYCLLQLPLHIGCECNVHCCRG